MIKQEFISSMKKYIHDSERILSMWSEIQSLYSRRERFYHTISHLNSMLTELSEHKHRFTNWDTIVFALIYHDIIYNPLRTDNEERSAEFAEKRLAEISFPKDQTAFCRNLILATKKHEPVDPETDLFTDADLSILGSAPSVYKEYAKQIRAEYAIYPDFLYNKGRKKVLAHFLGMPHIYKTKPFSDKYEATARTNLKEEVEGLSA